MHAWLGLVLTDVPERPYIVSGEAEAVLNYSSCFIDTMLKCKYRSASRKSGRLTQLPPSPHFYNKTLQFNVTEKEAQLFSAKISLPSWSFEMFLPRKQPNEKPNLTFLAVIKNFLILFDSIYFYFPIVLIVQINLNF